MQVGKVPVSIGCTMAVLSLVWRTNSPSSDLKKAGRKAFDELVPEPPPVGQLIDSSDSFLRSWLFRWVKTECGLSAGIDKMPGALARKSHRDVGIWGDRAKQVV